MLLARMLYLPPRTPTEDKGAGKEVTPTANNRPCLAVLLHPPALHAILNNEWAEKANVSSYHSY